MAVLMVVVGLVVAARLTGTWPGGVNTSWRVYPGAFPAEAQFLSGPRALVPMGECFDGFGTEETSDGYISATWTAAGDCTAAQNLTPRPRPFGDALPSENRESFIAAVPGHDGGFLTLHRLSFHNDAYGFETSVRFGQGDGTWEQLALFEEGRTGHAGPTMLTAVDGGYVAVGALNGGPMTWTSTNGRDWLEHPVPSDSLVRSGIDGRLDGLIASGPDGRLVIVGVESGPSGLIWGRPVGWVSRDGALTWEPATMPATPDLLLRALLVHDGRYYAIGGDAGREAVMLTSTDGLHWSLGAIGDGMTEVYQAIITRSGAIVAVAPGERRDGNADEQCATAWIYVDDLWRSEELGCRGVPDALVELADGRIAAAMWGTLFLREPIDAPPGRVAPL
jgi:hypothetical protein